MKLTFEAFTVSSAMATKNAAQTPSVLSLQALLHPRRSPVSL